MAEPKEPFACCVADCGMTFTNEDHLTIHTKRHEMILQLGLGHKAPTFVSDQTPTPTRFIRNCEEVGLFQDLQNVNPFDETFKRAIDTKSDIVLLLDSTLSGISDHNSIGTSDDALHTPKIPEESSTAILKACQGATDLRTNLSINRSTSEESAVIVKTFTSQNDVLTSSKLIGTRSLQMNTENSSKVTIVRQNSLESAQTASDTNVTKKGDTLNNVEVKSHSNFEIRQRLQKSGSNNVVGEGNMANVQKSLQIPVISITDSSTSEFPNEDQEKTKSVVMKNDVMLTATSRSELNVTNRFKNSVVELISQKSLDMAIDSLTSGCLKRIDSLEEMKSTSYSGKNDNSIESQDLISKINNNLQSVLHTAIEKHTMKKTQNNLAKANKKKVTSNENTPEDERGGAKDIIKRRHSELCDEMSKYKRKKANDMDSEYEITLKLPNGKKVLMKSVDIDKEEITMSPKDYELSIEYPDMSDTKQKLKEAINDRKSNIENSQQNFIIARGKTSQDSTREISTVSLTTRQPIENPTRTYILPENMIPVIESSSLMLPETNVQQSAMEQIYNENPSHFENTVNRNIIVINNKQMSTKFNPNTQLLPHFMTNANTEFPSNQPTMSSLNKTIRSTSPNKIIGNVVFVNSTQNSVKFDPQNSRHIITNANTVLPSNKLTTSSLNKTIQTTSPNTIFGNVVFIKSNQNSAKLNSNKQNLSHITNVNTVLPTNEPTIIDKKTQSISPNKMFGNVVFMKSNQHLPDITNANTVSPSNKQTIIDETTQSISPKKTFGNVVLMKSNQNLPDITISNTVLPTNKPTTIEETTQSTSCNDVLRSLITINNEEVITKSKSNKQLSPNNTGSNKPETTSSNKASESNSMNNSAQSVIFINANQNLSKFDSNTQFTPHMTYTKTVLPTNKINSRKVMAKSINVSPNGSMCHKVGIPMNKTQKITKDVGRRKEEGEQTETNESTEKCSRQERQNAAVQRYRKRQSELKQSLAKKTIDLKAQNEKLTQELAMAQQEIAKLRELLETHENCTFPQNHTGGAIQMQPVLLQHRYIIVTPDTVQTRNENMNTSQSTNNQEVRILSSGNEEIGTAEGINMQDSEMDT